MPEVVIPEKYVIPRFTLPDELTNKPEAKETPKETPAEALPKEEPKPVAEAATTEPEKPEEPAEEETTGKDPEKTSQRRFERRIDRAHRARAEAQARAEQLERELQELKTKQTPAPSGAPRMEDFTDVQEYAKAFAQFEKDNAIKDYEKKQRDQATQVAQQKITQEWDAKVSKALSEYDDFEEIVGDLKPTTPWALAIMEAENGEKIAYYLGKHPKEAQRIIALSPLSQVRDIGKLEMKLSTVTEAPKPPSKAPPPIAPVTGASVVPDDTIKPQQPFEEYLKIGDKMFRGRR